MSLGSHKWAHMSLWTHIWAHIWAQRLVYTVISAHVNAWGGSYMYLLEEDGLDEDELDEDELDDELE
jgi:hypothetical protein